MPDFHVETIGSGPRVVLVHGSVGNGSATWESVRPLADRYTLVILDRPGYPPNPPLDRADFEQQFQHRGMPTQVPTVPLEKAISGKADEAGEVGDEAAVAKLAQKILDAIGKQPLYYTDVAERFAAYDFRTVARALGHLHATEKLWQDSRGRMCVRGSEFAAKPPRR